MELTEKQKEFCREYVFDWNATRAYRKAYPDTTNDNSAAASAHNLLRNTKISEYLESLKAEREKMSGLSWLWVAEEFKKIANDTEAEQRDRIKALENINKMLGYNAPEKTESDLTIKNPIIRVGYGISNE